MLSKLLSNINAGKNASADEAVSSGSNSKEGGMSSSEQAFKALLQSLQSEGSSSKAKQQLLALSGSSSDQEESAEGENISQNILGGSFAVMGEEEAKNLQQADQSILKELQKEFQNIKSELTGDEVDASSESEEKVKTEQASENVSEENTENVSEEEKNTNSDTTNVSITNGTAENVAVTSEGKKQDQEGVEKTGTEKKSAENLVALKNENADSDGKGVEARVDGTDEKVGGEDFQKGKGNAQSTVDGKNVASSQEKILSTDVSKEVESSVETKTQDEQIAKSEAKESQEKMLLKQGVENQERQGKLFEKAQRFAGKQVQPDRMKQPDEGQILKNQNTNSGNPQAGLQLDGGQTAKTELTEQQKKVMGSSFFQKNSTANISTKGLEMKGVQSENEKKNTKGKGKAEKGLRGFGKQSSEGRNKLLNRLGISSANAQKEAKPLNLQNFSGISAGDSSSSLKEQKINWEEQVTKVMDSSGEKESKASSSSGSMRLGQMPVANVSLRKKILPGLTQSIKQAASSAKENSGDWQKHTFTLDDGKNIQLSVRESKGVLQIKMGSMNLDLSKFLQQNLQQIRDHVKQEFGSDIDLQFENQQQGDESGLSDNTDRSSQKRNYRNNFAGESLAAEHTEEARTKTVRNFGYNQMEWTA
ncbi:hypothetical protein [Fodinibius sp. Rm-B-1B1-1]|uniref:hypothetical protein n=1 Tax=Fodinibius alkaliphilus TaxID=3140241 RepID=UPI00315B3623